MSTRRGGSTGHTVTDLHKSIITMIRGLSYFVRDKLYLAVTNQVNSVTSIQARGPGFEWGSKFVKLSSEPTPQDLYVAVTDAFEKNLIKVDSMEADEITFAGYGEPLLRYDVIAEASKLIKESHHGVPLRVKTNGLIETGVASNVALELKEAGM